MKISPINPQSDQPNTRPENVRGPGSALPFFQGATKPSLSLEGRTSTEDLPKGAYRVASAATNALFKK
jgi:hypothetical protein